MKLNLPNLRFQESDKKHPLYNTWWNMIARCYIPIAPGFTNYSDRGIAVSSPWFSFSVFIKDVGPNKPKGTSLDRIDNELGYSKKNCKWSSHSDQMLNRRTFGNNKTGETGVVKISNRYEARFQYEGVRYRIGRRDTVIEAKILRKDFITLFFKNPIAAINSIPEQTLWCTSTTKIRGISKHKDGGFIVRVTENKIRKYLGYFKTFGEAADARREYNKK